MTELVGLPAVSVPLPWQAEAWTRLIQQLEGDQLPHALLLTGPEHTGKARLALALARYLLCGQPVDGHNCGHCHSCELSGSGNHGDFRWLEPELKSRAIKIDQVRALVDFSNRTAGFGLRKVVVISPAERMNPNAANALLKVLEEPAANTYLVLVSHRPHGLPATIRSRCQQLRLALPGADQALGWLDPVTGGRQESEKLLELARGRPLLAEQLYREAGADRLVLVRRALAGMLAGKLGGAELGTALAQDSIEQALAHLLEGLQALLRNLDGQRLASAQARSGFLLVDEIQALQRAINAGSNPNPQILLDSLLAKLQRQLGDGGLGDNIRTEQRGVSS